MCALPDMVEITEQHGTARTKDDLSLLGESDRSRNQKHNPTVAYLAGAIGHGLPLANLFSLIFPMCHYMVAWVTRLGPSHRPPFVSLL